MTRSIFTAIGYPAETSTVNRDCFPRRNKILLLLVVHESAERKTLSGVLLGGGNAR